MGVGTAQCHILQTAEILFRHARILTVRTCGRTGEHFHRMLKTAAQQGRSE